VIAASLRNKIFKEYCAEFPGRVPPEDAGRPVIPILVEFFCGEIWERLLELAVEVAGSKQVGSKLHAIFEIFDVDHNGEIDEEDLTTAISGRLGKELAAKVIVQQMLALIDKDDDGKIHEKQLRLGLMKLLHHHVPAELKAEFRKLHADSISRTHAGYVHRLCVRKAAVELSRFA